MSVEDGRARLVRRVLRAPSPTARYDSGTTVSGVTSRDALTALSEEFWTGHLAVEPTEAHLLGYYPTTGRFEDASRSAEDAEIARLRDVASRADKIDPEGLDEQERITRAVLVSQASGYRLVVDRRRGGGCRLLPARRGAFVIDVTARPWPPPCVGDRTRRRCPPRRR